MNPEEVTFKRILSSLLLYVLHQGKFRLSAKHKAHALHKAFASVVWTVKIHMAVSHGCKCPAIVNMTVTEAKSICSAVQKFAWKTRKPGGGSTKSHA